VESTRILLEGRPGTGKTTLARLIVELLRARRVPLSGFTTEELRERGRRVGFAVETVRGERGVLAHVDLPGPPRVGKYGVDLVAFETIALPELRSDDGVVVVDEIGKMELASRQFREALERLFEAEVDVVATVHVFTHPVTDALKERSDVQVLRVTPTNRSDLAETVVRMLRG
jgi:nucleoside-triphosphatase